tara:strand:+ start:3059 stop:3937 length:879 start_codon:yes stop_codon:yes gene_type:complete
MSKLKKILNKRLRKFYFQRRVYKNKNREIIAKRQSKKNGKLNFSGSSILKHAPKLEDVNTLGYTSLGVVLDQLEVDNLLNSLNKFKCFDGYRPELGTFYADKIPEQTHVANYKREDLVSVKEVMDIANDPKILSFVQEFLYGKPTISTINAWWSLGGRNDAEHAQLFHRDVDDYKFIKFFIYLTDVGQENGPHVYVETSAYDDKFKTIRRFSDEEIEESYGKEKVKYITGKKGEGYFVNTYGIHKGLLPKEGRRLILQVQYSINEVGIEEYNPIEIDNAVDYDKYINRLLIK